MFRSVWQSFLPRNQPLMTRQSYTHEIVTSLTMPISAALVEGAVAGVLAEKVFNVSDFAFATIYAAPLFANVTSFLWSYFARGKTKVWFITVLQFALLATIASIAVLPTTWAGGLGLVALVVVCRCLLAGIITLRSTIWRHNYPRHVRARITGKLVFLATIVMGLGPLVAFSILDDNPEYFRIVYPAVALMSVVGVLAFSRIRLRREAELLRYERQPSAKPTPHGDMSPIYEYDPNNPVEDETSNLAPRRHTFMSVLRNDHHFRSYMTWQMFMGLGNLIADAAIVRLIIRWTDGMDNEYAISILLGTTIPMLVGTATLPLWARLLDKMHIARYRIRHGGFFVASQLGYFIVALFMTPWAIWLVAIPRVIGGAARGGGMIAWNLGHNDFADRRLVTLYMGIHVTLTGLRGATATYIAVILLDGWDNWRILSSILPAFDGIGPYTFLVSATLATIGWVGFARLARSIHQPADSGKPN